MASSTNNSGKKSKFFWRRIAVLSATCLLLIGFGFIWASTITSSNTSETEGVKLPEGTFDTNAKRNENIDKDMPECGAGNLQVTAATDKNSYGPDEKPKFTLTIENVGDTDCQTNVGTSQMIFEVQTGGQTVWLSTHCQEGADNRNVVLEVNKPLTTQPLEWDRTFSDADTCNIERESVTADGAAYHLLVAVGQVPGKQSAQFLLY